MKIQILLGAAVLALVLISTEGRSFGGRGGGRRHGHEGGNRRRIERICSQEPESGRCFARKMMWFYNSTTETCEMFTYGGCGGNRNRFFTEEGCMRRCSDPCTKPLDEGEECTEDSEPDASTRYYYDAEDNSCKEFEYTGCGGNTNRFRSLRRCERRCVEEDSESSSNDDLFDDDDSSEDDESSDEDTLPEHCRGRIMCAMHCEYGFQKGSDGCPICRCNRPEPIEEETSRPALPEHCRGRPMCMMYCHHGFQKGEDGCPICKCNRPQPIAEETSRPAVPEHCLGRPMCRMRCRFGFQTGDDGCPICRCNPPPVAVEVVAAAAGVQGAPDVCPPFRCLKFCQFGYEQYENGCSRCVCKPDPTTPRCPRFTCAIYCEFGREVDENGCDTCSCKPPAGPPFRCPRHICMIACRYGREVDENGCDVCRCKPPPVDWYDLEQPLPFDDEPIAVAAAAGTDQAEEDEEEEEIEEEEEEVSVVRRRIRRCPRLTCRRKCQYGFQKDELGCDKCACNAVPEQCADRPVCLRRCARGFEMDDEGCATCRCLREETRVVRPRPDGGRGRRGPRPGERCTRIYCLIPCEHGYVTDENGCQQNCECLPGPNSESTDVEGPILERPGQCPVQVRCLMHCRHGYQRDENGCQTCRCREPPSACKPLRCRMGCPFGYKRDENGCKLCECLPRPTPRPRPQPDDCPLVRCLLQHNCPFGFARDERGCQTCQCRRSPTEETGGGETEAVAAVAGVAGRNDICSLPQVTGPCMAYFPRFHYNAETGACEQFVYGGCRGNENNFLTEQECRQTCGGTSLN